MPASFDLPTLWAGIIAFAIFAYVVMDGFDLGIGILFATFAVGEERDMAMNAIAPVWDGNETWLVLGGGGLMAAFPVAYGIIMPATYPLIIAMLLGLVFRGVAFEFRWREERHRRVWDNAFALGSLVAAFAQGVILGALLHGIPVRNDQFNGAWFDWLSPFSVLTGLSVICGYSWLGACWLVWKAQGPTQDHARRLAFWFAIATLAAMTAVSIATPLMSAHYWRHWLAMPDVLITAQVPLLVLLAAVSFFWRLQRGAERAPFLIALAVFGLNFAGLGISFYPEIVPPSVTIWRAASPASSLWFLLAGAVAIIPVIIGYTGWAYWVFRGKTGHEGYH